jgi:hypothetical protein
VTGSDVDSGIGSSDGGAQSFAASNVSVGGAGLLAKGSRSGFGPSFAGDEGAPVGAGSYFLDALSYCGDTARPSEDAALWPWGYMGDSIQAKPTFTNRNSMVSNS